MVVVAVADVFLVSNTTSGAITITNILSTFYVFVPADSSDHRNRPVVAQSHKPSPQHHPYFHRRISDRLIRQYNTAVDKMRLHVLIFKF